ncbi:hypothetical protein RYH80_18100 [Halobaculum sp. MBLA0147]|uniref:hypothetical protein n=1 Tax=Halobaculum sp. MBLA0147 TaxID=3079934 RepID=UPI0035241414
MVTLYYDPAGKYADQEYIGGTSILSQSERQYLLTGEADNPPSVILNNITEIPLLEDFWEMKVSELPSRLDLELLAARAGVEDPFSVSVRTLASQLEQQASERDTPLSALSTSSSSSVTRLQLQQIRLWLGLSEDQITELFLENGESPSIPGPVATDKILNEVEPRSTPDPSPVSTSSRVENKFERPPEENYVTEEDVDPHEASPTDAYASALMEFYRRFALEHGFFSENPSWTARIPSEFQYWWSLSACEYTVHRETGDTPPLPDKEDLPYQIPEIPQISGSSLSASLSTQAQLREILELAHLEPHALTAPHVETRLSVPRRDANKALNHLVELGLLQCRSEGPKATLFYPTSVEEGTAEIVTPQLDRAINEPSGPLPVGTRASMVADTLVDEMFAVPFSQTLSESFITTLLQLATEVQSRKAERAPLTDLPDLSGDPRDDLSRADCTTVFSLSGDSPPVEKFAGYTATDWRDWANTLETNRALIQYAHDEDLTSNELIAAVDPLEFDTPPKFMERKIKTMVDDKRPDVGLRYPTVSWALKSALVVHWRESP